MNNRRIASGARVTQYKYTAFISKCRIFVPYFLSLPRLKNMFYNYLIF